jgi:dTDP-4-amino-4,6-dideoxygalactose transaminase
MKTVSLFTAINTSEMEAAAIEVMRSGRIASGAYVTAFETYLTALLGQQNIVTTINMSSAIHLALYLSEVRAGDDVLTSAFACMSTNSPIATLGARPIWVDMKANSAYIDVADFEAAITPKTKAAILYHLAGYPGPAKDIAAICKKHGITLIEDCDNALLAAIDDKLVGGFGDFAVYSFYPNRQINTTEGGALVCKNPAHVLQAKKLRRFGIDATTFRASTGEISEASVIPEAGWSIGLNNICSAIGCSQLPSVAERMQKTRANAAWLIEKLSMIPQVTLLHELPGSQSSYWALLMQVEGRDAVLEQLKSQGVLASKLHQRNDIYTCFIPSFRNLPNTTELQRTVIALPCGWWLTLADLDHIVQAVKNALAIISQDCYQIKQ